MNPDIVLRLNQSKIKTIMLAVGVGSAALFAALIVMLFPAYARAQAPANTVSLIKSASTTLDPQAGTMVADGEFITYTLSVQNNSTAAINSVSIEDILPEDTFDEASIECLDGQPCFKIQETDQINDVDPFDPNDTTTVLVTSTTQITWAIGTLQPGQAVARQFKARVICRPDNFNFGNIGLIRFNAGNSAFSNLVNTVVKVVLPQETGEAQLSRGPTWCSTESSGNYDLDWGDADNDGDLDLILGSSAFGAVVYRNDEGQLSRLEPPVYDEGGLFGVRWADFDNDHKLDILVTGKLVQGAGIRTKAPDGSDILTRGQNYIYKNNFSGGSLQAGNFSLHDNGAGYTFESNQALFRTAVADFDNDGDVDIAGTAVDQGCKLYIYNNINPANLGQPPSANNTVFNTILTWTDSNVRCLNDDDAEYLYGVAVGDYNNDGKADLAVAIESFSLYPGRVEIYRNTSTTVNLISFSLAKTLADSFTPGDLAWGDYNNDGYLDLAVALLYQGAATIFRSSSGNFSIAPDETVTVDGDSLVYAVDWSDLDGDGRLELALGTEYPSVFDIPSDPTTSPTLKYVLPIEGVSPFWSFFSIRAVDIDNDGDLELSFADRFGRSYLFTNFAPLLETLPTMVVDGSTAATDIALGNVNGGGLDLLLGAGSSVNKLYTNNNNGLDFAPWPAPFRINSQAVAFADVNLDGKLDIAFGSSTQNQLYYFNSPRFPTLPDWQSALQNNTFELDFSDFDQDNSGFPDFVAGNSSAANTFYLNSGGQFEPNPTWQTILSADTRSVAWGYLDHDDLPDFAAGNYGQPTRIYRNSGYHSFTLAQELPASNARSAIWGDYDGDGDMDLAVGNYSQPNFIYENQNGTLGATPIWKSPDVKRTTSLAWGDWDNDGDLDLAVGNANQPDQVYANLSSTPGAPKLFWIWKSDQAYNTQNIAWGDADGDGDLELALASPGQSGFFRNSYVSPAHHNNRFMPLPLNPTYLKVEAPIPLTGPIWKRPIMSDSSSLQIPITFTVYDPDGPQQNGSRSNLGVIPGQYGLESLLSFSYALAGSGNWQMTTNGALTYTASTQKYTFLWHAGEDLNSPDAAVSDDVRFRVSVVHQNKGGRIQRAQTSAASPPFRIRNLGCIWPEDVSISYQSPISKGTPAQFTGAVVEGGGGSGGMIFTWEFGDGSSAVNGQVLQHAFDLDGTYPITLTVSGDPCPVSRTAFATTAVTVSGSTSSNADTVYLPLLTKTRTGGTSAQARPELATLHIVSDSPSPVTQLQGSQSDPESTRLTWQANPAGEGVLGYRVYRLALGDAAFALLANLPQGSTSFVDETAACGYAYFVTAYNAKGESPASARSYYGPPCSEPRAVRSGR